MNRTDFDAFHDAASKLLAGQRSLERLLSVDAQGSPPRLTDWQQLAQNGWFRLLLAEEHGGLGLDVQALGAIFLAVGARPLRGPMLEHAVTLPLLRGIVTSEHASRLDASLDGERFVAIVQPLPSPYGPGAAGIELSNLKLNGTAELVPFAQWADDLVVVAQAAGEPVLVLVDAAAALQTPCACVDPSVDYSGVELANIPVRASDILLRGSEAALLLQQSTDVQRLMVAAELAGAAAEMVRMSVDYAKTRQQFGRPIGSFQAMGHLLADMAAASAALRSLVDAALADASAAPERLTELGMIAKVYACTVGRELAQNALQVHGGIGFTAEMPLHLYMRRVLTHQGFLGETDELLDILGSQTLQTEQPA